MTHPQDVDPPVLTEDSAAALDESAPRKRRSPRKRLDASRDAEPAGAADEQTRPPAADAAPAAPAAEPGAGPSAHEGGRERERLDEGASGGQGEGAGPQAALEPTVAGVDGASDEDGGPRRSRRNRRRGRKGRALREDGTPIDGAVAADGSAPPATRAMQPPIPMPDAGELFATVTSGAFDDDTGGSESPADPASSQPMDNSAAGDGATDQSPPSADAPSPAGPDPERRVLLPDADAPKLQKVLAQAGVGSRRDLEQMIIDKRVTVNGETAHTGQRISWGDRIAVDGKPVRVRIAPLPARVVAYHKPVGEVVSHDDPQQRPTVFRRLPRLQHGKWQSVGRLDINTEGLLLFTNSGELANQLMHPRFGVEREYAVRVLGTVDAEAKARLLEGVSIDGQPASFKSLEDGGGEGANHWYRVVITEGRNREVRRLFDAVGLTVSRLIRIRYGSVVLPRGLKRGVCVDLSEDEVKLLRRLTGLRPQNEGGRGGPDKRRGGPRDDGVPRGEARPDRGPRKGPRAEPMPREARPPREPRPPQAERGPRPQQPSHANRVHGGRQRPHAAFGDAAVHALEFDDPGHEHADHVDVTNIPNPLQQTFDQRAIREARSAKRELSDDAPIPNPLQQTYDKRALKENREPRRELADDDGPIPNPLQQTYDKRFAQGGGPGAGGGPGRGRKSGPAGGRRKPGGGPAGGGQPDPMKTAVGYIGGDAFLRKKAAGRAGGKGPGGNRRGGRGGQGGPGGKGR